VTRPTIVADPLPPFGSPLVPRVFRGNEAISLSWIPPDGGADGYEVAYTSDGGVRWAVVSRTSLPRVAFIPVDTTSAALVEVVARRGDAVVGTWLSAPFVVDLEVVPIPDGPPARFALRMTGESPARASVRMALDQPRARDAALEIFDVRGARVRTLWRGNLAAGRHAFEWDGSSDAGGRAAAGIYLVRARSGTDVRTLRVALLR